MWSPIQRGTFCLLVEHSPTAIFKASSQYPAQFSCLSNLHSPLIPTDFELLVGEKDMLERIS